MKMFCHKAIGRAIRSSLIVSAAAIAVSPPDDVLARDSVMARNPDISATESYWTEERLRNAEPLSMPVAPAANPEVNPPTVLPKSEPGEVSPGAPPSVVDGDADELDIQLYTPEEDEEELLNDSLLETDTFRPTASSRSGAVFTSSRVFPPAAVRAYPYSTVGKLFFFNGFGNSKCTGVVIERRLILTAAHCVYDPARDVFFDDFAFVPAFDRGRAPFGLWNWDQLWVTPSWMGGDGTFPAEADFALIQVADKIVGNRRRAIGDVVGRLAWQHGADPVNHITSLGYSSNLDAGERLQQTHAPVFDVNSPNSYLFGTYFRPGASGGPVVANFGQPARGQPSDASNEPRIIGVNSYENLRDWIAGASILNDEFVALLDQACAGKRQNCGQATAVASAASRP